MPTTINRENPNPQPVPDQTRFANSDPETDKILKITYFSSHYFFFIFTLLEYKISRCYISQVPCLLAVWKFGFGSYWFANYFSPPSQSQWWESHWDSSSPTSIYYFNFLILKKPLISQSCDNQSLFYFSSPAKKKIHYIYIYYHLHVVSQKMHEPFHVCVLAKIVKLHPGRGSCSIWGIRCSDRGEGRRDFHWTGSRKCPRNIRKTPMDFQGKNDFRSLFWKKHFPTSISKMTINFS